MKLVRYVRGVIGGDICSVCGNYSTEIMELRGRNHEIIKRACESCLRKEGW